MVLKLSKGYGNFKAGKKEEVKHFSFWDKVDSVHSVYFEVTHDEDIATNDGDETPL